jgi:uncharacterized membrane protein YkvA (DUF1232 family)
MKKKMNDKEIIKAMEKERGKAEKILGDGEKFDRFLSELEIKLRKFPGVGKQISDIPVLIAMLKSYMNKEYTVIPVKSIAFITMALVYFVSPVDAIPDFLPLAGMTDDLSVLLYVLSKCHEDVEAYRRWKDDIIL